MVIGKHAPRRAPAVRRAVRAARRFGRISVLLAGLGGPLAFVPSAASASDPTVPSSQPRPVFLNLKRFEIPFNIDVAGKRPSEVQLHVSRDAGATWALVDARSSTAKHFPFEATEDGDYWFATRTLDATGQAHPAGPISPQLAVRVDTTNPQVEWETEVAADGSIDIRLTYADRSPIAEGIRIEYSIDGGRPWIAVTDVQTKIGSGNDTSAIASTRLEPGVAWRQITLRALVGDVAGNKVLVTRQVDRPRVATAIMKLATNQPVGAGEPVTQPTIAPALMPVPLPEAGADPAREATEATATKDAVGPPPTDGQLPRFVSPLLADFEPLVRIAQWPPAPLNGPLLGPGQPQAGQPQPGQPFPTQPTAPYYPATPAYPSTTAPLPTNSAQPDPAWSEAGRPRGIPAAQPDIPLSLTPAQPPPRPQTPAEAMRPLEPSELPGRPSQPTGTAANPAASSVAGQAAGFAASNTPAPEGAEPTRSMRPQTPPLADFGSIPVRHSNSRMFSLEYEIESSGLSGISDVELWGTTDRGATWKRWGSDPDRQSPFDIETNHDGDYGFQIVVVSSTGLATPRPQDGDPADMIVVVDTQAPTIRITGAAYGQGNQTGHLIIRYRAEDANLGSRPITLAFSDSISGPWSTIAAGLANDGIYAWPADPHLPRQIYLRVDVADQAGNRSHYILDTPIDVQGLAPRARIRGFNPLTGSAGGGSTNDSGEVQAVSPTRPRLE